MSIYIGTQITAQLKTLLEGVTQANGSHTDVGESVLVNQRISNEDEAPCVVLMEGDENGQEEAAGLVQTSIGYTVSAYVNRLETLIGGYSAEPAAEWVIKGALIQDLREKLEPRWCPLSAFNATLTYEGASREAHDAAGELCGVELRYLVQFSAAHGDFHTIP